MSSISSDLYEEILKLNKSHTNLIIQIVLCKTVLIQLEKDCTDELIISDIQLDLTWRKQISNQKKKTIYGTNGHL